MKKQSYWIIGIILFVLYLIWRKRNNKNQSSYNGYGNVAVYNFENTTGQPQSIKLFSSVFSPPSGVTVQPSTIDLQAEVMSIPKVVGNIRIRSSNQNQVEMPIKYQCSSVTGSGQSQIINPRISPTQFQPNVVDAPINNLLLDGRCYLEYTVLPNTQVTWSISYNDYRPQYMTQQALGDNQVIAPAPQTTVTGNGGAQIQPAQGVAKSSGTNNTTMLLIVALIVFGFVWMGRRK